MTELYCVSIYKRMSVPRGLFREYGVISAHILIMGFYRVCATDDLVIDRVGYGGPKR